MTAPTWQSAAVTMSVQALRAGSHEDRHGDELGRESLSLLIHEMHDHFGAEGVVGLAFTLALVAGTILNETGDEQTVDALLNVYALADVDRRFHAMVGQ
jgi:hypothetical protein